MDINRKKPSPEDRIAEIQADLDTVILQFKEALSHPKSIEDQVFLDSFAENVCTLGRHAKEDFNIPALKEAARLIHHVLYTPIGAPFTANTTLLQASIVYPDEIPLESELCRLLKQFAHYQKSMEIPFSLSLEMLSEELHKLSDF